MEAALPAFGWRRTMWSQAQSEVYKMPDILLGESQIEKKRSVQDIAASDRSVRLPH